MTLSIFCYKNYSDLLKALNSISDPNAVLETGAHHRGGYVLVYAGEATPALKLNSVETGTLAEAHAEVLPAYFKQKAVRAESNLVCVESEQLARVFEAVNQVLKGSDFQCIEIHRSLADNGHAYALFANGTQLDVFKDFSAVRVTKLDNLSSVIKKYF